MRRYQEMTGHAAGKQTRPVIPSASDLASRPHALGCIGTALACAHDGEKAHRKAFRKDEAGSASG
jgi:hypothetical protein